MANENATPKKNSTPQATRCGCPRQYGMWLCRARVPGSDRPARCTPTGQFCELRVICDATNSDQWTAQAAQLVDGADCECEGTGGTDA